MTVPTCGCVFTAHWKDECHCTAVMCDIILPPHTEPTCNMVPNLWRDSPNGSRASTDHLYQHHFLLCTECLWCRKIWFPSGEVRVMLPSSFMWVVAQRSRRLIRHQLTLCGPCEPPCTEHSAQSGDTGELGTPTCLCAAPDLRWQHIET